MLLKKNFLECWLNELLDYYIKLFIFCCWLINEKYIFKKNFAKISNEILKICKAKEFKLFVCSFPNTEEFCKLNCIKINFFPFAKIWKIYMCLLDINAKLSLKLIKIF